MEIYRKMNKSASGPETVGMWAGFRADVTAFALRNMKPDGSTVVIGAGNMNDFDCSRISRVSSELVLADIDVDSVRENAPKDAAVEWIDFGCLDEFPRDSGPEELMDLLKGCSPGVRDSLNGRKFDNILVSPFYTQLVLPLVFPRPNTTEGIVSAALELAGRTIILSNRYIRSMAKPGCRMIFWTDVLEYNAGDIAFGDILKNINDNVWMDGFLENYNSTYGLGLGSYGHLEMEENLDLTEHGWLIWPFDGQRRLIVRISSGRAGD